MLIQLPRPFIDVTSLNLLILINEHAQNSVF